MSSITTYMGFVFYGQPTDVVELDISAVTRAALRLPDSCTKQQLAELIPVYKQWPDARFPRGKWATIQRLESLLCNSSVATVPKKQSWTECSRTH